MTQRRSKQRGTPKCCECRHKLHSSELVVDGSSVGGCIQNLHQLMPQRTHASMAVHNGGRGRHEFAASGASRSLSALATFWCALFLSALWIDLLWLLAARHTTVQRCPSLWTAARAKGSCGGSCRTHEVARNALTRRQKKAKRQTT